MSAFLKFTLYFGGYCFYFCIAAKEEARTYVD